MSRTTEKENTFRDVIKRSAKDKASSLIATYYVGRTEGKKIRKPLGGLQSVDEAATGGAKKKQNAEMTKKGTFTIDKKPSKIPLKTKGTSTTPVEYGFEMIDGNSDTEDYVVFKLNRPRPPKWAHDDTRRLILAEQAKVSTDVIDKFFGSQAENVDLLEIFPKISKQRLKRRPSSSHWNTPPRYSTLPKY